MPTLRPARPCARRAASHGATLVEFALVAPLFLFVVWGIFAGAWYVLEVSAVTNAAREAASWEVAASNFVTVNGVTEPYCMDSGNTVPAGLISAAASTAGPFSGQVTAAAITNTSPSSSSCTITLQLPYSPLATLVPFGPSTIRSSSTVTLGGSS